MVQFAEGKGKALINIAIFIKGSTATVPSFVHETEMSTDLPAEHLGEAVAIAIQMAWKAGNDPTTLEARITFR